MPSRKTRILILCKTYPSPSARHAETSCVAGMEEDGALIRLYPVPFRLVSDKRQFKKWQWIEARIEKAKNDHRPESHKIYIDTIACDQPPLPTTRNWQARREWLGKIPVFEDFAALDNARKSQGITLGIVRPRELLSLEITPTDRLGWSEEERAKLIRLQQQADLFDETDAASVATLRKLPFDFHYRYNCGGANGPTAYRHKVVDWEVGALFWNVRRAHGDGWQTPLRDKLEVKLPSADLMFLMGTIHRFPDQWLIVSLLYPPRLPPVERAHALLL